MLLDKQKHKIKNMKYKMQLIKEFSIWVLVKNVEK